MKVGAKVKSAYISTSCFILLIFSCVVPFFCRCYGRAVCCIPFIIPAPVVRLVSFFIRRRKWAYALCSCRRFFGTMENAYSLTRTSYSFAKMGHCRHAIISSLNMERKCHGKNGSNSKIYCGPAIKKSFSREFQSVIPTL